MLDLNLPITHAVVWLPSKTDRLPKYDKFSVTPLVTIAFIGCFVCGLIHCVTDVTVWTSLWGFLDNMGAVLEVFVRAKFNHLREQTNFPRPPYT